MMLKSAESEYSSSLTRELREPLRLLLLKMNFLNKYRPILNVKKYAHI